MGRDNGQSEMAGAAPDAMSDAELRDLVAGLAPEHAPPNAYLSCPSAMSLIEDGNRRRVCGSAIRCGCSRPGYPDRGVFQISYKREPLPHLWIYEGGRFFESCVWHDAYLTAQHLEVIFA